LFEDGRKRFDGDGFPAAQPACDPSVHLRADSGVGPRQGRATSRKRSRCTLRTSRNSAAKRRPTQSCHSCATNSTIWRCNPCLAAWRSFGAAMWWMLQSTASWLTAVFPLYPHMREAYAPTKRSTTWRCSAYGVSKLAQTTEQGRTVSISGNQASNQAISGDRQRLAETSQRSVRATAVSTGKRQRVDQGG
jgi:hypothetical protein